MNLNRIFILLQIFDLGDRNEYVHDGFRQRRVEPCDTQGYGIINDTNSTVNQSKGTISS